MQFYLFLYLFIFKKSPCCPVFKPMSSHIGFYFYFKVSKEEDYSASKNTNSLNSALFGKGSNGRT